MNQFKKYFWLLFIFSLASCGKDELLGPKSKSPHLVLSTGRDLVADDTDSSFVKLREVALGVTSRRRFTIKNEGAGELHIGKITTDNNLFTLTQPAKTILKAGQTTTFTVSFTPERFGERMGRIGFFTNDQENPAFHFKIIGSSLRELSISYIKTDTPEGLNTATLDGGIGTKFISTMELFDPFKELDAQSELVVSALFSNGVRAGLVKVGAGTGFFVNNSLTRLRFNFSIAFGESDYLDMEVFLRLPNGKKTPVQKYRINRPLGAK